jgi:hypothetical protein
MQRARRRHATTLAKVRRADRAWAALPAGVVAAIVQTVHPCGTFISSVARPLPKARRAR